VCNIVKNHKLGLSISDAAWSMFTNWVNYFAKVRGVHGDRVIFAMTINTGETHHEFVDDRQYNRE
jgi:transposase